MAIGALLGTGYSVGSKVASFFGETRDEKNEKRFAETDALKKQALAGDKYALTRLMCLSGDSQYTPVCKEAGMTDSQGRHGYATSEAQQYARAALSELQRAGVFGTLGESNGIGATLGSSPTLAGMGGPGVLYSPQGQLHTQTAGFGASVPPLIIAGAALAGIVVLLRNR